MRDTSPKSLDKQINNNKFQLMAMIEILRMRMKVHLLFASQLRDY
jgi:hypothetical protein